ncbi:MAG TPA: hypothetical protein VGD31_02590 [Sphingobacteriaceae bacterium]
MMKKDKNTDENTDILTESIEAKIQENEEERDRLKEEIDQEIFKTDFNNDQITMEKDCHVKIVKTRYTKAGVLESKEDIANCIIEEGELIDHVESGKTYARLKIRYKINNREKTRWIHTEVKNIFSELDNRGHILKTGERGKQAIRTLVDRLHIEGIIKSREGHHYPGIYMNKATNGVELVTEYLKKDITDEKELREAIKILEDFIADLTPEQQKIAVYMFLHQLTAPYDYVRKSLGLGGVTGLLLYGESHTGKTTVANATTYLFQNNEKFFEIEKETHESFRTKNGQEASTEAQFEDVLKATTLPIIIDEAETIINDPKLLSMWRRSINTTTIRKVIKRDRTGKEKPKARNTPILITNDKPTELRSHKGETRRIRLIEFRDVMRITDKERVEAFKNKWKVSDTGNFLPNTPLKRLWIIGATIHSIIEEYPDILGKKRLEAGRELLQKLYRIARLNFEESIFEKITPYKPPTIDEIKQEEIEMIIDKFKEIIARNWKDTEIIRDIDETFEKALTLPEKAYKIAETRKLPWFTFNTTKKTYAIARGFLDVIRKELGVERTQKGLAIELARYTGDDRIEEKVAWFSKAGKAKKAIIIPQETLERLLGGGEIPDSVDQQKKL